MEEYDLFITFVINFLEYFSIIMFPKHVYRIRKLLWKIFILEMLFLYGCLVI